MRARGWLGPGALALLTACATVGGRPPAAAPREGEVPVERSDLPPIPPVRGALRLDVVYPAEDAALTTRGSNFIFGSTGNGAASLRINGTPVPVAPNGAFLAFLPVPQNGVYRLEASAGAERTQLTRNVRLPTPADRTALLDTATLQPRGAMTVREGERVRVRFLGAPGSTARLLLPDGTALSMVETVALRRSLGFAQDRDAPEPVVEYVAEFTARAPLRAPGTGDPLLGTVPAGTGAVRIEVAAGGRATGAVLPLTLAVLHAGEARLATVASGRPDRLVHAAAVPGGGAPTAWPLPDGTRVAVTGERDGALRLQLHEHLAVWAPAAALRLEPRGRAAPEAAVDAVRVIPAEAWVDLRLGTAERPPFHVSLEGATLVVEVYGARSRTNWAYHGPADPLVRGLSWEQPRDDLYRVRLELARPAWGWETFWDDAGALIVRVRRGPAVDPARPLRGLHVAVDAGHPPGGATGPTRLTEAEANLAISRRLSALLREAGARVTEIRPDTAAVALIQRPLLARQAGADLFVSVHNNAFPDGVNPFESHGTATFYNAPQSAPLARSVQRELLRELGLPDLGVALADLAVVRPTWMPSVLTESMFLMIPQQEAALRDPAVHERIARAHLRGIETFVREYLRPAP